MSKISLTDLSLKEENLTPRAAYLKDVYFSAYPQVDAERPKLLTEYFQKHSLFDSKGISILDTAKAYRHVLKTREAIVHHDHYYAKGMERTEFRDISLFAGSTTNKFKGVIVYPEFFGLSIWPELWSLPKRKSNPFQISEEEVNELNSDVFPHWVDFSIKELTRKHYYGQPGGKGNFSEMEIHDLLVFFMAAKFEAITHTIPDLYRAIYEGLGEVIKETGEKGKADNDKKEFYDALGEALHGIIDYSNNLAAKADGMAGKVEDGDPLKGELNKMAEIYRHVPANPARNFREGLTTVWLCWIACHLENANTALSLGRLDQLLYPLYIKDIDSGELTVRDAIELICCLWLKIGDHVPLIPETGEKLFGGTGSNQAITLGGVDSEGEDAVNDLTYVMLRATELMMLRDPNLNARYHPEKSPREYLERICEVNINTRSTPAIHNDRAIIDALMKRGDSLEHARDYGVVGCVEPCSVGRAYLHTGAILINLTSALEMALFNGSHRHSGLDNPIGPKTGRPENFGSFVEFRDAFAKQTRWLIERATNLNNNAGRIHQQFHKTPILSALFEGPMDKGLDVIDGGAKINSSALAIIGLADVADSLSAIEELVFREGLPFANLIEVINGNFKGSKSLWARLNNPDKTPKWGNENKTADASAAWVLKLIDDTAGKIKNYRGGDYRVGYWTMTMHAGFGKLTEALPSGRKSGESFSSGFTPESGKTPYLTKTLNSVAGLPSMHMNSGVAFNLKYTPENGPKMLKNFAASVAAYFDGNNGSKGGVEIQFNVTNRETFEDAVKNPDKYPELLVRVSGYTAYFRDLNPQMQKEIIDRTEYLLSTGRAQDYEPFPLPKEA